MEGVERYKVRLLRHNPAWAAEFYRIKSLLEGVWGDDLLAAEHVGSTAIPATPAKPVLDVAVMVRSLAALDREVLVRAGYDDCGWQNEPKTRLLFVLRGENQISLHHIHCYQEGDPEFYRQVGFRDYLNAHPESAQEYAALKERLAETHPDDRAAYTRGKAEFILRIHRAMDSRQG